jgi:hypothetical protein
LERGGLPPLWGSRDFCVAAALDTVQPKSSSELSELPHSIRFAQYEGRNGAGGEGQQVNNIQARKVWAVVL